MKRLLEKIVEFKEQNPNAKFSECMDDETEDDEIYKHFIRN